MSMKKIFFYYFILIVLALSGCQKDQATPEEIQASFDAFTNEFFLYEVQSDTLTLNYSLSNPESYGITDIIPTLGDFSVTNMQKELAYYENQLNKIKKFKYAKLTQDQQLTYDILMKSITHELEVSNFLYFMETLGPTTGIQAQLPVLLAEYNFYTKDSIDEYIALLHCVPDYFEQISAFEKEKSEQGMFMSDETADDIIAQCQKFIQNPQENFLIDIFNERIHNYGGLTNEEKISYQEQNRDAILNSVIPAYESLVTTLTGLKGTGTNTGGLSLFPGGKEFYSFLVKNASGSSRSIEEIEKLLDTSISASQAKLSAIVRKSPDAFYDAISPTFPLSEPQEIITYLKGSIEKDFPAMNSVECTVKYVHKSLEDNLSPAFYLNPAFDDFMHNSIYINQGKLENTSNLFTTLAHEGYPGHLYQSVYYNQQSPSPVRHVLHFGGYSEGWATYVELYSYSLAGLDKSTEALLENNFIATLCVYAKADVGVNYHGWNLSDTATFLSEYGITDEQTIETIYKAMVAEPSNYMKYTLGYLEVMELRKKAEEQLGDKFVAKEFHEFILKTGPCWFDILDARLEIWIKNKLDIHN